VVRRQHELTLPGLAKPIVTEVGKITAIWAVEAALISGIVLVLVCGYAISAAVWLKAAGRRWRCHSRGDEHRLGEYGFGAVIAALPGFLVLSKPRRLFRIRC
jgi:hypothetical protein